MCNKKFSILFYIFIIFNIFNIKSIHIFGEPLKFRADYWCPYNCATDDNDPGYLIEILQLTFGKENVNYETIDWETALKGARIGEFDGIVGINKNEGSDFIFGPALASGYLCFYKKTTSKFHYNGIKSLNGFKLGVQKGYSYYNELDSYIQNNRTDTTKIDENSGDYIHEKLLKKIEENKIDVFVEDPNVIKFVLKKNPKITNIAEDECKLASDIYVAFSPKNKLSKERANQLRTKFKALIQENKIDTILKKYNLKTQ